MITLDNLFTFFEFIAEENTYIQHQPGTTGTTNRFSRFSTETTTGQLSKLGYSRLEVVQLPFGLITDFNSSQQETLTARVRVIYKLSDKFDFDEEVTALDNAKKALFQMLNYIQTAQDECPGNSLLCAFDMNSVRYTLLDKATFSGSAVGCELSINFKKGICWEEVAYGDFPEYNGTIALPDTNGQYVLQVLNGVISWHEYSPTGQVVISRTLAQFKALAAAGTLQSPATYKITDVENGLYVKTFSGSEYATCNLLSLNCPKTYETTTLDGNVWKGIWRSSKTANINDLFIWGGVVWKNKTGNIGSSVDVVTLDAVNWEYIDRNNFSNNEYTPLTLICYYDFEQSWVNYLQDEHNNILGVDWHTNQIYSLTYNPALQSDWNCMSKSGIVFGNNQLFFVANNLGNVIGNKTNGFIYSNNGDVLDNKYCSVIANNEQDVYENIAAIADIDGAVNEVFYVNGGSFYFTHNFTANPLTSGSSIDYGYIPSGDKITSISASGTLTGTNIEIGLETDDEAIISGAVGLLPLEWSGASIAATANRSLKIKATGGNITAGVLTVKVEFVV